MVRLNPVLDDKMNRNQDSNLAGCNLQDQRYFLLTNMLNLNKHSAHLVFDEPSMSHRNCNCSNDCRVIRMNFKLTKQNVDNTKAVINSNKLYLSVYLYILFIS